MAHDKDIPAEKLLFGATDQLRGKEIKAIVERLRAREAAVAGSGMDPLVDRLFEQAQILYRRWPEVEGAYAPAPRERVGR